MLIPSSHVELDEAHVPLGQTPRQQAVRREWKVRYASTQEIDAMALSAGLQLEQRWETYSKDPFSEHSRRHISVYGKASVNNS
jgi:hypothetical protein